MSAPVPPVPPDPTQGRGAGAPSGRVPSSSPSPQDAPAPEVPAYREPLTILTDAPVVEAQALPPLQPAPPPAPVPVHVSAPRIPAPVLFMTAGVSQYAGAALAVTLFTAMAPVSVAWLRGVVAAIVLVIWRRPWRATWTWRTLAASAVFGLVLTLMNVLFYISIAHIPLGTAVAVEFTGPVLLAMVRGRSFRTFVGAMLAGLGVLFLGGLGVDWSPDPGSTAIGLLAAAGAGAAWATYMVIGGRIAAQRDGMTSLSVGMAAGALALAPIAAVGAAPVLSDARLAFTAIAVGLLSSAIPYAIDQVALKRLKTAAFALLNSLLPATAAVVGRVVLGQRLSFGEVIGLVLISWAVAMTTTPLRRGRRRGARGGRPVGA